MSCKAATGGTRPARRAGVSAESTVAMQLTPNAAITVRADSTNPVPGKCPGNGPVLIATRSAAATPVTEYQPGQRRNDPEEQRLQQHRPAHLPGIGTDATQQSQLTRALRDRHRNGEVDHERADQRGHRDSRQGDDRPVALADLGRAYGRHRFNHATHRRRPTAPGTSVRRPR
jgi:hypothetical protein